MTDNVNFIYLHHHLIYRHFSLKQMKAQKELHSFFCYDFSCLECIFYTSILYRSYRLSGKLSASDVTEGYLLLGILQFSSYFWFLLFIVFLACSSFSHFTKILAFSGFFHILSLTFRYADTFLSFFKYSLRGTFNSYCSVLKYFHANCKDVTLHCSRSFFLTILFT